MASNTTPEHVRIASQKAQRIAALVHELRKEAAEFEDLYWGQDLNTVTGSPAPSFVVTDERGNISGTSMTPAQLVGAMFFTEQLKAFLTGQPVQAQNFWAAIRRIVF